MIQAAKIIYHNRVINFILLKLTVYRMNYHYIIITYMRQLYTMRPKILALIISLTLVHFIAAVYT